MILRNKLSSPGKLEQHQLRLLIFPIGKLGLAGVPANRFGPRP